MRSKWNIWRTNSRGNFAFGFARLGCRMVDREWEAIMTDFDPEIHRLGMKLKFVYSLVGLLVGVSCIFAGVILGLAGVVGHTSWTASALGFSTNMTDATPGVIVFVVGIFFVLITRFKIKHVVNHPNRVEFAAPDSALTDTNKAGAADPAISSGPLEALSEPTPPTKMEDAPRKVGGSAAPRYSSGGQSSLTYTTHVKL